MNTKKQLCLGIVFIMLVAVSCSTDNAVTEKLFLTTDKTSFNADGFDQLKITVKNEDGEDCTLSSMVYINDRLNQGEIFTTETPGSYKIKAEKGTAVSDVVSVEATDPGPSSFTRKIVCEDFTGAWCGHCPRVGIHLENYVATNPKCIVVGIHNGDSYSYAYESQMRSYFGVQGFPTVIVDRSFPWSETDSELNKESAKRAVLGLALETSIEGTTLKVKAKVKSDITTTIPMKLVVLLVEDNLISSQRNYGYWGLPDPITDYSHKNVLRAAATNIFGDDIPTTAIVKNSEWSKDLTFSTTGYNISNCKVIAFVVYGNSDPKRVGVLNAQQVAAGENKAYD